MDRTEFFGNLVEGFKSKAVEMGQKANKFVNIKKLEFEISRCKSEIDKLYKDLGIKVYTAKNNGSDNFGNLDGVISQINMKKDYINAIEKQIELINEEQEINNKPVKYTENMPKFIEHPENNVQIGIFKFCPKCNTGNEPESEACKNCGEKLS